MSDPDIELRYNLAAVLHKDVIRIGNIRKTFETPPRISVCDVMVALMGRRRANVPEGFLQLLRAYPEARSKCIGFSFDSEPETPVTDLLTIIGMSFILPGKKYTTQTRIGIAQSFVGWLGEDLCLVGEVQKTMECCVCGEHMAPCFLAAHFEGCFELSLPSTHVATEKLRPLRPWQLDGIWKSFPKMPPGISKMLLEYLLAKDLLVLRCVTRDLVPASALESLARKTWVSAPCSPQHYRVVSGDPSLHCHPIHEIPQLMNCCCSFSDPFAETFDATDLQSNVFKILRASSLTVISFSFTAASYDRYTGVMLDAPNVLWLPVRVLALHWSERNGPPIDVVFLHVGGKAMAHLDDPIIKYVWKEVQRGSRHFRIRVSLTYSIGSRSCYQEYCRAPLKT